MNNAERKLPTFTINNDGSGLHKGFNLLAYRNAWVSSPDTGVLHICLHWPEKYPWGLRRGRYQKESYAGLDVCLLPELLYYPDTWAIS